MISFLQSYFALFHDSYTFRVVGESLILVQSILPGLIAGLFISSFLIAYRPSWLWNPRNRSGGFGSIFLLACIGIVSPFCSYLAIPLAATMIANGVQPAPVFAFLFATPLMNPNLFLMTWSAFEWPMAVARDVSALGFGLLGGVLAKGFASSLSSWIPSSSNTSMLGIAQPSNACTPLWQRWMTSLRHQSWFVIKYVLIGVCVAAAIKELIPMQWILFAVGRDHSYGILIGAMLGVPLYACGGGSIPIIQILLSMGMSPGAALAFFIAGPATKVPTLMTMHMTLGFFITGSYFLLSLGWSVICGTLFQKIVDGFMSIP